MRRTLTDVVVMCRRAICIEIKRSVFCLQSSLRLPAEVLLSLDACPCPKLLKSGVTVLNTRLNT